MSRVKTAAVAFAYIAAAAAAWAVETQVPAPSASPASDLGPLLDAVIRDPHDIGARSRLDSATRRLQGARLASLERDRREALEGIGSELERARQKAAAWDARMEEARRYRDAGRWIVASDLYLSVLRSNPKHGDALEALREARREIAHKLDVGGLPSAKERHLYAAFFHYLQRDREKSRDELRRALHFPDVEAELPEAEIRRYQRELASQGPLPIDGSRWTASPVLSSQEPIEAPVKVAVLRRVEAPAEEPAPAAEPRRKAVKVKTFVTRRADFLFQEAKSFRKSGKLEEAQRTLGELLELEPEYPNAREAAFEVQERIRSRILESKTQAEAHYGASLAHYGAGRLEDARAELERAIAADPEHPYARDALDRLKRELAEKQS